MTVETITNGIEDLDNTLPAGTDPKSEGDNHMRNLKTALGLSFPGSDGAWNTTDTEIQGLGYNAKSARVRNVGVPTDATDAARKGETDALDTRVTALEGQIAITSFGNVGAAGNSTIGSGDYSVVKEGGNGTYLITWAVAASSIDANITTVTTWSANTQDETAQVEPVSASQTRVRTNRNGNLQDIGFYFTRIRA